MIVRPWVTFTSSLPDDTVEEDGEIVQYGGKGVANVVADMLRRLGCKVEDPAYADEHGWDWDAYLNGRRFFFQVTEAREFMLLIENPLWLERIRGKTPQDYIDLLRGLQRELEAEPRFSDLVWYTRDELGRGAPGASVPVEAGQERKRPRRRDR